MIYNTLSKELVLHTVYILPRHIQSTLLALARAWPARKKSAIANIHCQSICPREKVPELRLLQWFVGFTYPLRSLRCECQLHDWVSARQVRI